MEENREKQLLKRIEALEAKIAAAPIPKPKPDADEEAQKRALYRIKKRRRYDK